jgi:integrase/recombinase XerD
MVSISPAGQAALLAEDGGAAPDFSGAQTDGRLIELWLYGKAEGTKKTYLYALKSFGRFTGGKPLRSVTLSDLQEYASSLGLLAPATQARMLAALKSLLSFGNKVGYLPFNVGGALKLPAVKDTLAERVLSEAEVHRMMNLAASKRDRAIIAVMYAGGLRREEVCALKWRDVKKREDGLGQITVFGKGGKTANVLLPEKVFKEILALKGAASEEDPLFKSRKAKAHGPKTGGHLDPTAINRIVGKAAKRAGIESNVSPHWLRHSHATHAMRRGADLALIKETLRHSSIATTSRYLHARPDDSSAMYLGL